MLQRKRRRERIPEECRLAESERESLHQSYLRARRVHHPRFHCLHLKAISIVVNKGSFCAQFHDNRAGKLAQLASGVLGRFLSGEKARFVLIGKENIRIAKDIPKPGIPTLRRIVIAIHRRRQAKLFRFTEQLGRIPMHLRQKKVMADVKMAGPSEIIVRNVFRAKHRDCARIRHCCPLLVLAMPNRNTGLLGRVAVQSLDIYSRCNQPAFDKFVRRSPSR